MDEGIKKMWYIHAIKYYSVITKKEILLLVTTLIILKDFMISGQSRHRKTNTICIHVCPTLNPPPSSLPTPSLWVVPVH